MPAAFLTVVTELPTQTFELKNSPVVIGRAPDAEWQLNHREISRRHCQILKEGEEWQLEDLASRWGTRVNGSPLAAKGTPKIRGQSFSGPSASSF